MRSVRLPEDIDKELESLANQKKVSRSDIIKEALVEYMAKEKKFSKPFEIGVRYFGKHGSGERDRSISYKSRIRSKIRDKRSD